MPRPRGEDWLEDEIQAWRQSGIDVIVSLLTPDELADLDLTAEQELCRANRIKFVSFPNPRPIHPFVDGSVFTSCVDRC